MNEAYLQALTAELTRLNRNLEKLIDKTKTTDILVKLLNKRFDKLEHRIKYQKCGD